MAGDIAMAIDALSGAWLALSENGREGDQGKAIANAIERLANSSQVHTERTKAAVAEARKAGKPIGRQRNVPSDIIARIIKERQSGASFLEIRDSLAVDGIPAPFGNDEWPESTIRRLYYSETGTEPAQKRHRRTRAEMEQARAALAK